MKVGILITSISNFGKKGFYNSQEVGLAKALSRKFEEVEVFKLIPINQTSNTEEVENYKNVRIKYISAKNLGINGLIDVKVMDASLDLLIHFSDTQFSVPTVYRWCKKNEFQYIPYIGVIESHSTSRIKRLVTNIMFKRNINVYRKCLCCVKTPEVQVELSRLGVNKLLLTPVGLDIDNLKSEYSTFSVLELKNKYGYQYNDKVLLFVGRLIDEKRPIRMIEILKQLREGGNNYKLIIVGSGELKKAVEKKIRETNLEDEVKMLDSIHNSDIWELYRLADAFVNLNQQEIFGMAILEAMYYECKVVAWSAPGPNYIIENGVSGFLAKSDQEICNYVISEWTQGQAAHKRVVDNFVWDRMAKEIGERVIQNA